MPSAITCENIVASISNGVIAADADGKIVYINRRALNMLELDSAAVINVDIHHLIPGVAEHFRKCVQRAKSCQGQYLFRRNRKMVIDMAPIKAGSEIAGVLAALYHLDDFTEALRYSDEYLKLKRQLDAIFKGSSDGLWIHDSSGKILNINTVSEMINGVRARDVIGKSIYDLVDEGIFEGVVTPEILKTKRQCSTLSYIRKTGKQVLVTGTPILDEEGNISLIVSNERDLTHWNAVKEDLERSRKVAEKYRDELEELSLLASWKRQIVAESKEMQQVLRVGMKLARMGASNILIQGESGTGKGLLAKFIHDNSRRKPKPFIPINCAALPESLLEAELFGYEKGAFTGAREEGKIGLFELAHEGTLFLDEIGDLPLSVQAKLLKYLDDHEILPLGGIRRKKVDCSVIAATNQDLERLTEQNLFRRDLFFRLNTFMIHIPPLRHRPVDIVKMVEFFLDVYNRQYQVQRRITAKAIRQLQAYPFPGNVRELQNIIRNAVVLSDNNVLDGFVSDSIGAASKTFGRKSRSIADLPYPICLRDKVQALEKDILSDAYRRFGSTRKVAQNLGTSQSTIMRKMKKYRVS